MLGLRAACPLVVMVVGVSGSTQRLAVSRARNGCHHAIKWRRINSGEGRHRRFLLFFLAFLGEVGSTTIEYLQ